MIKIVLLCFVIIIAYLVFSKLNIQENFSDPAKTVEYADGGLDKIDDFLADDNIKIYKTTIKRGTPKIDPQTNQPTEVETDIGYGLKAEDLKNYFPNAIVKDGQVELVSGDSLAALLFGMCRDNYKNINRIDESVNKLKADLYALETKDTPGKK
jgi:hypothetical protein